ncbi:MAG TPA: methyltransferase type 12, partial [Thermoanaerobaculia bacterium]|nr:methyltransferase type 12 [Thermoanaerobaculia bacterium]
PGGRLLLETINPDSLYAMRAYRLDPTHRWPVPAPTLSLLVRDAGFEEREIRFVSPVPPAEALEETGENERKLNRWLFGFQDYALFAERPRA